MAAAVAAARAAAHGASTPTARRSPSRAPTPRARRAREGLGAPRRRERRPRSATATPARPARPVRSGPSAPARAPPAADPAARCYHPGMRVCPVCARRFEADARHCTQDGTPLNDDLVDSSVRSLPEIDTLALRKDPAVAALQDQSAPREPREERQPGALIGEFRIDGTLGEGGMGVVYSGRHPLIGKRVAIKVIHRYLCTRPNV